VERLVVKSLWGNILQSYKEHKYSTGGAGSQRTTLGVVEHRPFMGDTEWLRIVLETLQ
jgi:hypothetical protein